MGSCPAALGSEATTETQSSSLWRLNGEALEVSFDGLSSVADARSRAAAVLNISPTCVSLVGSKRQAIEDGIAISDLDVEELQLIVSSDGDTQRTAIEEQVAAALNAACLNDASTVDRHADLLNSLDRDDLVFALQLVLRHVSAGAHPECCADLLL